MCGVRGGNVIHFEGEKSWIGWRGLLCIAGYRQLGRSCCWWGDWRFGRGGWGGAGRRRCRRGGRGGRGGGGRAGDDACAAGAGKWLGADAGDGGECAAGRSERW